MSWCTKIDAFRVDLGQSIGLLISSCVLLLIQLDEVRSISSSSQGPTYLQSRSSHHYLPAYGGSKIEPPSRPNSYWDDPQFRPYFDETIARNVTAQLGKTAYLPCRIRQLADRTVSWVRRSDLHILTVGRYTYTSDQRFTCIHIDDTEDWTLEIKYVQKEDVGTYECQISTEPKMSLSIRLGVVAAKASIPEGPEVFVKTGTNVNLSCVITQSTSPPVFVFWYHDGTVINYDSPRGGVRVTTDKGPTTVSRLQITAAKASDAGDYSCKPSFADFANVTVHIVNSEKPQAMHHADSPLGQNRSTSSQSQASGASRPSPTSKWWSQTRMQLHIQLPTILLISLSSLFFR